MTNMRKVFICFFSMLLWFGLSGCAEAEPEQPENVEIHFFIISPVLPAMEQKSFLK